MNGHSATCAPHATAGVSGDIRVLLVDDHPMVRASLTDLLSDEDGLTVVGECEDGSQVLVAAARLRPDVVLMDVSMPVMDGLTATQALRAAQPEPRVVVLTGDGVATRPGAVAAGAHALVPKDVRPDVLLECLRAVVAGCGCCQYCF